MGYALNITTIPGQKVIYGYTWAGSWPQMDLMKHNNGSSIYVNLRDRFLIQSKPWLGQNRIAYMHDWDCTSLLYYYVQKDREMTIAKIPYFVISVKS